MRTSDGFLGELLRTLDTVRGDPTVLGTLTDDLKPLREKLAAELEAIGVDLGDPTYLSEVLGDAEAALVCRLAGVAR